MGIRWVVGATNGKKREEPQDNADYRGGNGARNEGGSGGGSGGAQNNGGSGGGSGGQNNGNSGGGGGGGAQGGMYPSRYYPALPPQQVQVHPTPSMGGGGAMSVGYYADGYAGDMPSMYGDGTQKAPLGFITEEMIRDPENRHRSRRTGRFVRGEGGDEVMNHSGRRHRKRDEDMEHGWVEERGEDEVRELKKKIRKIEEKLEDADSSREVKRLKSRIEELEEKLEEGMKREKRGGEKKKKSSSEDEEEDGEDDPAKLLEKLLGTKEVSGKEFLKDLPLLFRQAVEVIKSPPPTWPPYIEKKDFPGIYTMESKELAQALEQFKAGSKGLKDVEKELKHTCAALIQLACHALHEKTASK